MKNNFDINNYDYLFFDFDGVILDSEHIKTEGFAKIYERYGKNVVNKVIKHHLVNSGMDRFRKFKFYHKEFLNIDLTDRQIKKLARKFSQIVLEKILKARYIKGAPEFLKLCKKKKKRCFLVSATPEKEIKKTVRTRRLSKYFNQIKGSPQSKEENIKDLVKKYKIDRTKSVFFGDSINDLKAANYNNIKFVGINYFKPIMSFKNFSEILKKDR